MPARGAFLLSPLVALLLAGPPAASVARAARPAASFDFFHVEANEGGSAGGHAALRIGPYSYHFQYAPNGLLEMARTRTADFLTEYALLSNRSIHVSRVGTDAETVAAIGTELDRRYRKQRVELRTLSMLAAAPAWLEGDTLRAPVPGAGYFDRSAEAAAVGSLRLRIERRHGADALEGRRRRAEALARAAAARGDEGVAEALQAASCAATAVELMRAAWALDPRGLVVDEHPTGRLDAASRARLESLRDTLEERLVELFGSRRPDWGSPFVVGVARLLAVERSLEAGRWVFLDSFPADAEALEPRGERWARVGPQLLALARTRYDDARRSLLFGSAFREQDLARLESAATNWVDMRRGVVGGEPIRLARALGTPSRPAAGAGISGLDGERLRARLRAIHAEYRDGLESRARYNVISRNCVSALFESVDRALASLAGRDDPAAIRDESMRRLGAWVQPGRSLAFVPVLASRRVRAGYRNVEAFTVISDRQARLREMRSRESAWSVHLRESNVLSSTLYERSSQDSLFLFFTEDPVAVRPLYGLVNLATGLGGSVAGLLWAPFDRGDLLVDGLRGVAFSLPELFFVNIRKGSNDFVITGSEREALAGDAAF